MSERKITKENAEPISEIMKAVGHPIRLSIIDLLCENDERVTEIAEKLDLKQALVSQQLRILRMSGLVEVKRNSGISKYTLAEPRLRELIECIAGCKR